MTTLVVRFKIKVSSINGISHGIRFLMEGKDRARVEGNVKKSNSLSYGNMRCFEHIIKHRSVATTRQNDVTSTVKVLVRELLIYFVGTSH